MANLSKNKRKIGVLTSGGDAPGMNAVIRSVVRTAIHYDFKVLGIKRGFEGLINADIVDLEAKSVSDIIHRGGTILHTARCAEMLTDEGKERASQVCKILGIDALVIVGGNGSFNGGAELANRGVNIIGIPATIDLDLPCSDYTIGFDTAVNTGMDAINKIRDTSSSHERCSVVEIMGRNAGFIALWCGMTGGAEEIVIPEKPELTTNEVIRQIIENRGLGKNHNLIIVAEGVGNSYDLSIEIEKMTGIQSRATILGHLQRGGSPSAVDRMHAAMMGYNAVELILNGERNRIVIYKNGKYGSVDIFEGLKEQGTYDDKMYEILKILAV